MNPRLLCRERSFHKALLLTYSFDPVFFEQIVLPDLWAGRASDILVIGDSDQVQTAIKDAVGRLWHLVEPKLVMPRYPLRPCVRRNAYVAGEPTGSPHL